ncbi:hypothetical protein PGT21_014386 [Puccinia graminis f. sp. tritici]|uniref:Uncharacterized protein n=1 Tax=Puccinia graminis f. sp. tritici TaxID=56615 RepID=A0A5B0QFW7_PUCGR|nr:hypothetical protein PGT21_014386 [Puccinia graminis f. sp. tritici]
MIHRAGTACPHEIRSASFSGTNGAPPLPPLPIPHHHHHHNHHPSISTPANNESNDRSRHRTGSLLNNHPTPASLA